MNDNIHNSHKRQIDIRREELATYTEQFLARGGRVVELPLNASKAALVAPPMHVNLRSSVRSAARKRQTLLLQKR
ncbi:hypothetical protein [Pseudomonas fluorescens]|uniref:Uncharacterized protein n=1 Tax=Pseudomonas fluorescens TaxID=294 RepID=A0A5E7Q0G6_PSEFL|nr:hypothetical protein [Pseudomonas fluorescens]VVP54710.1 hypothetical protein PS880_05600 [Pseudomonas fluorescens]